MSARILQALGALPGDTASIEPGTVDPQVGDVTPCCCSCGLMRCVVIWHSVRMGIVGAKELAEAW